MKPPPVGILERAAQDRRAYNRLFAGETTPCMACDLREFFWCQETGHVCKTFRRWVSEGGE